MARESTAADVIAHLRPGMRCFVHGAAATPTPLLDALAADPALHDITLYHLHLDGPLAPLDVAYAGRIRSVSLFTGPACRVPIAEGRADYLPVFLSEIPGLFRTRALPLDAALVQLSPPDAHGMCTLGPSVDVARAAVDSAPMLLAEINHRLPRSHGDSAVPLSRVTAWTETDRPLPEHAPTPESPVVARIGELIADLVVDGATLQMGIGAIPDAVCARLGNRLELGIHTEMFSDGVVDLVEAGVITNRRKPILRGQLTTSFVIGTRRVHDFVDDNPTVSFQPSDWTNDTALIRKIPRMTAINSALQVDLTGQVVADSIGHRIYSGIGGQMDFIRGAARAEGGRPIIALPSTAKGGTISRIVTTLDPGAGVVTTRGHVHWVVTEHGAVNLHGLTLRERGERLIALAHPDVREELRREWRGVRNY
ncbi:MAG: acetyl-CoA hydrolase/transferase C-terminal domain-containing protein [Gemmatimonadales bacterium]